MSVNASIRLTRFNSEDHDGANCEKQNWPLMVRASATNMPSEVFVYHVTPAGSPVTGDIFECVASVAQLDSIPTTQGVVLSQTDSIPYYRSDQIVFNCRSAEEADRVWTIVKTEVATLVTNYNAAQRLKGTEIVNIGETLVESEELKMGAPEVIQLSYKPAGTPSWDGTIQGISSPDDTKAGWLPVSEAPAHWILPSNAFLFYNADQDSAFATLKAKLSSPYNGNQLTLNGHVLSFNIHWHMNDFGLFWLVFDTDSTPLWQRDSGQTGSRTVNAPWPIDHVSDATPTAVPPIMNLIAYV